MPASRSFLPFIACFLTLSFALLDASRAADYRPGEILVEFTGQAASVVSSGQAVEPVRPGLVRLRLPEGVSVEAALAEYAGRPGVVHVQPNFRYRIQRVPNDPAYPRQWALHNIVTNTPVPQLATRGSDISAEAVWDRVTGDPNITVAIIDTGIDSSHEDLSGNLWQDANGDHGRNFLTSRLDQKPRGTATQADDLNGHGTLVAGIVAAVGDNGQGTAGVAWRARLMSLRACDENGLCNSSDIIRAIDFAIANGARIINASFGDLGPNDPASPDFDQLEYAAIDRARRAGVLFVASACNSGGDNDADPRRTCVPASYDLDNILAVAASDTADRLPGFSNYGRVSVDLAAPGTSILGLIPAWRRIGTCASVTSQSTINCSRISLPPTGVCRLAIDTSGLPPSSVGQSITVEWLESAANGPGVTTGFKSLEPVELLDSSLLQEKAVYLSLEPLQSVGQAIDLRLTLPGNGLPHVECSVAGAALASPVDGTSLAAAFVSGVAALLLADEPQQDYLGLRQRILSGVQALPDAADAVKVASGGRLDAAGALGIQAIVSATAPVSGGGGGGPLAPILIGVLAMAGLGRLRGIGYHRHRA